MKVVHLIIPCLALILSCQDNNERFVVPENVTCDSFNMEESYAGPLDVAEYLCFLEAHAGSIIYIDQQLIPDSWIDKKYLSYLLMRVNDTTACAKTMNPYLSVALKFENPSTIREEVLQLMVCHVTNGKSFFRVSTPKYDSLLIEEIRQIIIDEDL